MPIEIIIKFIILGFTGVGMYQFYKWLKFKDDSNKLKYFWNSLLLALIIGVFILTTWFMFQDNLIN
jgi:Trk-type K+ transport system membrane component